MNGKSFVIKELCIKSSEISQIEGIITANFKLKEIAEVRCEILPPRTVIGNNVIAYFGEVKVKVFCVDEESLGLFLAEQIFHYKGFFLEEIEKCSNNRSLAINSRVIDVFVEIKESYQLSVNGVISTEMSAFIEKEQTINEIKSFLFSNSQLEENKGQEQTRLTEQRKYSEQIKPSEQEDKEEVSLIDLIDRAEAEGLSEIHVEVENQQYEGEIYTGIECGETQDFTITLE